MEIDTEYQLTLEQLNEDCLMLIFQELDVADQFAILKTHPNFEHMILRIWRSDYGEEINFLSMDKYLRKLSPSTDLKEFLEILASTTKKLLNMNALLSKRNFCDKVFKNVLKIAAHIPSPVNNTQTVSLLPNILQIFPNLETLVLQNSVIDLEVLSCLNHLREMKLVHCAISPGNSDWPELFKKFRLNTFTIFSRTKEASTEIRILRSLKHCATLQRLGLNAAELNAAFMKFEEFPPQVKRVRVFTDIGTAEDDVVDPDELECIMTEIVNKANVAQFCAAVRLRCDFSKSLLYNLRRVPYLREFEWQAVNRYDRGKTFGKVQKFYDFPLFHPRTMRPIIFQFCGKCCTLTDLDIRWNFNATASYLAEVMQKTPQSVVGNRAARVKLDYFCPLIELIQMLIY